MDDYLYQYRRETEPLDAETERALATRALSGDEAARGRLIQGSMRWAVKMSARYQGLGVELDDLVSEAFVGLCRAADRYDPSLGHRFFTYAQHWIRNSLVRVVRAEGRTVRLPLTAHGNIVAVRDAERALRRTLGRPPSEEEVAQEAGLYPEELEDVRALERPEVSLDAPAFGEDAGSNDAKRFVDAMPDEGANTACRAEASARRQAARRTLDHLDERSRDVVERYYGMNGYGRAHTLEEIGAEWGVTRERVRQVKGKALRRLEGDPDARAALEVLEEAL